MLNIHAGRMWAVMGPLAPNDPTRVQIAALTSYQPQDQQYIVRLMEPHTEPDYWQIPAGLLPRVLAVMDGAGFPYVLVHDAAKVTPANITPKLFPLRPYQVNAVIALTKGLRMGGILQAATGAGKTAMAAKLIQICKTQTLFCVHTKDLMKQAQDAFRQFLGIEVGQIGAGKDRILPVTVATIQTLAKGRHDDYLKTVQLAMFDECHHVAAHTVYNVRMRLANAPIVVGLSASPWRDDGHDMRIEAACGPVKYAITASDLIDQGFLVPPEIVVYRRELPKALKDRSGGVAAFAKLYRDVIVTDPDRNRFVAALAQEQLDKGRRVLVLVKQIEHGMLLTSLIPGSVFVDGTNTSSSARSEVFDAFRSGDLSCLIGTSLCDEGVDIPAADALILAGAGASSTRALQRIGRVLRAAPGKSSAFVADIVDDHHTFRRQFYARNRIYKTERRFQVREVRVQLDSRPPFS